MFVTMPSDVSNSLRTKDGHESSHVSISTILNTNLIIPFM